MDEKVYGYTKSGKAIDDEMLEQFSQEAERGYVGQLKDRRRGRGRPSLGHDVKSVWSLRLDSALREEAESRALADGVTVSELQRRALRQYLQVSGVQATSGSVRNPPFDFDHELSKFVSGYTEWMNLMADALKDLNSDLKKIANFEFDAKQEVRKIVVSIQANSTKQLSRVKSLVEELEKIRARWDEKLRSKTLK